MRSGKTWLVGAVALVVLAGAGLWWKGQQSAQAADKKEPPPPPLVFSPKEVATAQMRSLAQVITFSGPLVSPNTATVKAKAAGTLLSLSVAEGSRVKRGQALGTVDLADLTARLQERQAGVASAQATVAQAERTHASNQRLADQQFISPIALDNSRAALDTARAQLGAAQAQVESARIALREAALVAPIDGIVAKRHALPGEKVAAEQPVLTLVDLRTLEMAGSVGTRDVARLKPGMTVRLLIEGDARTVDGQLARIAPSVDAGARSIQVTVALSNPDERWRAGQFALARVELPAEQPALSVPATAVGTASGQEYVWTLEKDQLVRRTVVTGRRDPSSGAVEVLQGLSAGQVVLAGSFENLREGRAARVGDATASAPAAAASR
ncbi:efflux RND transporter periplasmic adaptor subunit [Ideonella aquatica]|uniref:efflux RND transporter periplasmic adaptor subunit n=1 Tax=Ideonella aquatica TaxID=2824119 RepID=UPI001FFD4F22|nr:efflux RND transporter periplasmic adaptor subunit [Ideonella aquatica]